MPACKLLLSIHLASIVLLLQTTVKADLDQPVKISGKKYSLMNFEVFSNPRKSYLRVFEQTSQTILLSQNLGEI